MTHRSSIPACQNVPASAGHRVARLAVALLLCSVTPSLVAAQAAPRIATDPPSTNRETHAQHDSLAVHFIRAPKGKPAALSVAGSRPAAARNPKRAADTPPAIRVVTPLPTRKPKQ